MQRTQRTKLRAGNLHPIHAHLIDGNVHRERERDDFDVKAPSPKPHVSKKEERGATCEKLEAALCIFDLITNNREDERMKAVHQHSAKQAPLRNRVLLQVRAAPNNNSECIAQSTPAPSPGPRTPT